MDEYSAGNLGLSRKRSGSRVAIEVTAKSESFGPDCDPYLEVWHITATLVVLSRTYSRRYLQYNVRRNCCAVLTYETRFSCGPKPSGFKKHVTLRDQTGRITVRQPRSIIFRNPILKFELRRRDVAADILTPKNATAAAVILSGCPSQLWDGTLYTVLRATIHSTVADHAAWKPWLTAFQRTSPFRSHFLLHLTSHVTSQQPRRHRGRLAGLIGQELVLTARKKWPHVAPSKREAVACQLGNPTLTSFTANGTTSSLPADCAIWLWRNADVGSPINSWKNRNLRMSYRLGSSTP